MGEPNGRASGEAVPMNEASPGVMMAMAPWRPLWSAWAHQSAAAGRAYAAHMNLCLEAQKSLINAGLSFWTPRQVQDVRASARLSDVSRAAAQSQDAVWRAQIAVVEAFRRSA
jgi:hypothetical protein